MPPLLLADSSKVAPAPILSSAKLLASFRNPNTLDLTCCLEAGMPPSSGVNASFSCLTECVTGRHRVTEPPVRFQAAGALASEGSVTSRSTGCGNRAANSAAGMSSAKHTV